MSTNTSHGSSDNNVSTAEKKVAPIRNTLSADDQSWSKEIKTKLLAEYDASMEMIKNLQEQLTRVTPNEGRSSNEGTRDEKNQRLI